MSLQHTCSPKGTSRLAVVILLLLAFCASRSSAQQTSWTVTFNQPASGGIESLSDCQLLSVDRDTLAVISHEDTVSIRLFFLSELARPNDDNSLLLPLAAGTAIGAGVGYLAATLVSREERPGQVKGDFEENMTLYFALAGAALGAVYAITSHDVKYDFSRSSVSQKRAVIEDILAREQPRSTEHGPSRPRGTGSPVAPD